ncbi:MAG: dihydrofolate reductase [Planctomycetes bacterium]|nr:dihydrofolate reductase [Planctomycetota bacterium]
MIISLVAAMSENRVIGREGQLPWHLPDDLKFFKQLTSGHTVIMGRKTYDSVGFPLPKRRNIVLTRRDDFHPAGVEAVSTLDAALDLVRDEAEVFIVGGAEIYKVALPRAQRVYLTLIHANFDGDAFFPPLPLTEWRITHRDHHPADERHAQDFTFATFERLSR